MEIMKLSDYLFEFLKEKNVRHIFMLPGGGAMHLVDSLGKSGISYVPFLHEQAAAIAAEAYGQHTNTPGVLLVTSGPGGTNAITGVTAGWIDSTPMFIISGQAKRSDLVGDSGVRQIGSQEVQIVDMVRPITKSAVQILDPTKIRYELEKNWHEATSGRPGPVWLDIPLDVQAAEIAPEQLEGFHPSKTVNDQTEDAVSNVLNKLRESRKPLIIAGNGIKLSGAVEDLKGLLHLIKVPVETTWKTIDMFAEDDELYVGHPGIMGDRGANLILQESDFILSIGSRLDTSITAFDEGNFGKNATKIIIDIDEHELSRMKFRNASYYASDAGVFLRKLMKACSDAENGNLLKAQASESADWILHCKEIRNRYPVVTEEHRNREGCISAYHFIDCLCELLREDDVIVPESSGGAGEITYQAFRLKEGQKMKNAAGLGSMGFGVPYTIGACLANDRRRTILINGDGAFQLNIQELETIHRLRLPVKMFIWDNGGYASIRSMQRNNFDGHYVASDAESGSTFPDISKITEAYGFETYVLQTGKEMEQLLPKIMRDDNPVVCILKVDPEETVSPRVKAYITEDGSMKSGALEKMWPFISEG